MDRKKGPVAPILTAFFSVVLSIVFFVTLQWLHDIHPSHAIVVEEARFLVSDSDLDIASVTRQSLIVDGNEVQLPHDWRRAGVDHDEGWYRAEIQLAEPPDRLWGIYIPGVEMTPIVYVNGVAVGETLEMTGPLPRFWNRPIYFTVPNGILVAGVNVLAVHLAANGNWGRLSNVYLGQHTTLFEEYSERFFLRVSLLQITAVASFVIGLFVYAIWIARREAVYLWFSAFALSWGIQNWTMLTVKIPIPNPWWDWLVYTSLGFMLVSGSLFTVHLINASNQRWERSLIYIGILGPAVLALLLTQDIVLFNALGSIVWVGMLVACISFPVTILFRQLWQTATIDTILLSVAYCICAPLATRDWLVTAGFIDRHNGFMLQFAALPILISFGVVMVRRFVVALQASEDINAALESKVALKAAEISQAHQHARRLESERLLLQERERLMRDMHDGIGGHLVGTLAQLNPEEPRDAQLARDLRFALTELRLTIDSLDSELHDLASTLAVLRNRLQPHLDASHLRLIWKVDDVSEVVLGTARTQHLVRILQEGITNVIRHARATKIDLNVQFGAEATIEIRLTDNGVGLDTDQKTGRGLKNMTYRAREAGFVLQFPQSDQGTTIVIRIGLEG